MALNVMRFLPEPAATQLNRLRLSQPGRGVITGGAQSAEHGAGNARPGRARSRFGSWVCSERFYLFAETGEAAAWVKNIRQNPEVVVRIGERQIPAMARVLDRETDRELWDQVAAIADHKYGWGDGLPVELTPSPG